MPALPPAPNVMKVRIVGNHLGGPFVHVQHLQYSGGTPSPTDCNNIAGLVRAAYNTNFAALLSTGDTVSLFEITDLASNIGNVGSNNVVVTGTGGSAVNQSRSMCAVISWKNALHFRGGHCRTYMPIRATADIISGNTLAPTYQTALSTAAAAYLTALTNQTSGTINFTLAMLSYFTKHALRPTPISFAITSAVIHQRVDSQRRRLGKEF